VFVVLAVLVHQRWGPLQRLDQRIATDLNVYVAPHHGQVHAWQLVSDVFSPAVLRIALLILAAALVLRRRIRAGLLCAGTALGSLVIVTAGKAIVDRPRPHVAMPVAHAAGASFPSGHAFSSAAFALALVAVVWTRATHALRIAVTVAGALLTMAVGFSRMILGVHFLTDVLGAWLGASALVLGLLAVLAPGGSGGGEPADADAGDRQEDPLPPSL
jgi:membrane-associated phospholipid phosphatase